MKQSPSYQIGDKVKSTYPPELELRGNIFSVHEERYLFFWKRKVYEIYWSDGSATSEWDNSFSIDK